MKTCVFVLGMHRSGTSALAGAMSKTEVTLPEDLIEAVKGDNPKGYFESHTVVSINDDILKNIGLHYIDSDIILRENENSFQSGREKIKQFFSKAEQNKFFLIKDPRVCRLLPEWISSCVQMGFDVKKIFVFRNPHRVIKSLQVRDNTLNPDIAALAWVSYNIDCLYYIGSLEKNSLNNIFIEFESLALDPGSWLAKVGQFLDLQSGINEDAVNFFEESLIHHDAAPCKLNPIISKLVDDTYDLLKSLDKNSLTNQQAKKINSIYQLSAPVRDLYSAFCSMGRNNSKRLNSSIEEVVEKYREIDKSFVYVSDLLQKEKDNTQQQVSYRDALLAIKENEISTLEDRLKAEKENAYQQISYRDALLAIKESEIQKLNNELVAEKNNAVDQIRYRDSLVVELENLLKAEKENARAQVEYREMIIKELSHKTTS